jgi:hypothetical protein
MGLALPHLERLALGAGHRRAQNGRGHFTEGSSFGEEQPALDLQARPALASCCRRGSRAAAAERRCV